MQEFTIVVPCKYNDGTEVDLSKFNELEAVMLDRFGGWTDLGIVRGAWQDDDGTIHRDTSKRYAVATSNVDDALQLAAYVRLHWQQICVYLAKTSDDVRFI